MQKIVYFVTSNKGKVENAKRALKKFGISIRQKQADMPESRSEDPEEIALEKARYAYKMFKQPVIVEDSGFFINAIGGFPMTHVKFSLKTVGIKNILKMLKDVTNRRAEWRMSVAYVYGRDKFKTFTFIEKGEIAKEKRPHKRKTMSDYWYIYIPKMVKSNKLALSEMTEKNLEVWHDYYDSHNQFVMFGKWFAKQ